MFYILTDYWLGSWEVGLYPVKCWCRCDQRYSCKLSFCLLILQIPPTPTVGYVGLTLPLLSTILIITCGLLLFGSENNQKYNEVTMQCMHKRKLWSPCCSIHGTWTFWSWSLTHCGQFGAVIYRVLWRILNCEVSDRPTFYTVKMSRSTVIF